MFKTFALFQATGLAYENLLTYGLRCSLLLKILVKNGKNVKFLFDPFLNYKFLKFVWRYKSVLIILPVIKIHSKT